MRLAVTSLCAAILGLSGGTATAAEGNGGRAGMPVSSPTTITSFKSLFNMCLSDAPDAVARSEHSLCIGYFTGVVDFYLSQTTPAQRQFCLPADPPVTRQQARDKLVAWAGSNPGAFNQPAAVGVYQFMIASFPCGAP